MNGSGNLQKQSDFLNGDIAWKNTSHLKFFFNNTEIFSRILRIEEKDHYLFQDKRPGTNPEGGKGETVILFHLKNTNVLNKSSHILKRNS